MTDPKQQKRGRRGNNEIVDTARQANHGSGSAPQQQSQGGEPQGQQGGQQDHQNERKPAAHKDNQPKKR